MMFSLHSIASSRWQFPASVSIPRKNPLGFPNVDGPASRYGPRGGTVRLTAKERILVHLLETRSAEEPSEAPRGLAQEGIAEAVGVGLRHLAQSIRPLIRDGLVREQRAHVRGIRQRRKTYELTTTGRIEAIRVRDRALAETVRVQDPAGIRETSVGEALKTVGRGASLLAIFRSVRIAGVVDLPSLVPSAPSSFVEMLSEAPTIETFVGRREELSATTRDDGPRMFIVSGVAGIGKTWFAARACQQLHGTKNLFWHRVQPWDSARSILGHLGRFLAALGKPGLQSVLERGDVVLGARALAGDLPGSNALFVFDDLHHGGPELPSVFRLLLDSLERAPDSRALVLTRHAPAFYDRRDVRLAGLVGELELPELTPIDVAELGSRAQLTPAVWTFIRRRGGHPLLLQFLQQSHHSPFDPLVALEDFDRFLSEQVYSNLSKDARRAMKLASSFRIAIPAEALLEDLEVPHDVVLELTDWFLLRRVGGNRYDVHDSIRDFFDRMLTTVERRNSSRLVSGCLDRLAAQALADRSFLACIDYASNAIALGVPPEQKGRLLETLGDAYAELGDLPASTTAHRQAISFAARAETVARLDRKMAFEFVTRGNLSSAKAAIEDGFRALGTLESVEKGWLELMRAWAVRYEGKLEATYDHGTAALQIFQRHGDLKGQARTLVELARVEAGWDRSEAAEEHLKEALQIVRSFEDPFPLARVLASLAHLVGFGRGDTQQASAYYHEIDALATKTGNPAIRDFTLGARAYSDLLLRMDFQTAERGFEEAADFFRRRYDANGVLNSRAGIAVLRYYQGRLGEARAIIEEVVAKHRRLGNAADAIEIIGYLAEISLLAGDVAAFREVVERYREPDLVSAAEVEPAVPTMYRAIVALLDGDAPSARKLLDEAGHQVRMPEAIHYHRVASVLRSIMGDEAAGEEHRLLSRDLATSRSRRTFLATTDERARRIREVILKAQPQRNVS